MLPHLRCPDCIRSHQAFGEDEGEEIAKSLGPKNKTGVLQNHGLITVGETVDETVFLFNMMEKQCEIQLSVAAAAAGGMPYAVIPPADAEFTGAANNE
jgi:ribulose-5-phosphate 4-epimerase/fuculose-1-phosphate aldolase